jgi:hypothetical protein
MVGTLRPRRIHGLELELAEARVKRLKAALFTFKERHRAAILSQAG